MDSIWSDSFKTAYEYVRVTRISGDARGFEYEKLTNIVEFGGSISRNSDSTTYESGRLVSIGRLSMGSDLLRIYLVASNGNRVVRECLGTYDVMIPSLDMTSGSESGEITLMGRLCELDCEISAPITIPSGTYTVQKAKEICEDAGLEVVINDTSEHQLSQDWVYGVTGSEDEPDTKIGMVNSLLSMANFRAARTDPYGRVVFSKTNDSDTAPIYTFAEGKSSKFLDEGTYERDVSDIANHVITVYSNNDECVYGEAWDTDPASETSTVSIGYEKTKKYNYSDIVTQDEANSKAESLLKNQRSVIRRVTISHVYLPINCTDIVGLTWTTHEINGSFLLRTQDISLVAGALTKSELKRVERW